MKLTENNNILCSVSAGYSSVLMASKIKEWYPDHDILFAMANTSKEHIKSLEFMNDAAKHFGIDLNWIEAEFHEKGIGVTYNVVNFEDLKRNGEIFEAGIKKLGIPNMDNKWCNRDMKVVPLKKFADDIFGLNNYSIAIGIRTDEMDRVSSAYKENNIFYPLIENKINTKERNRFWKDQPIQIEIPAYKGNCTLCFEKSNRKLLTIMEEEPNEKIWWGEMIGKYGNKIIEGKPAYNYVIEEHGMQTFYRKYRTIQDLVKLAEQPFSRSTDEYIYENDLFDLEGECGSGCTVFK